MTTPHSDTVLSLGRAECLVLACLPLGWVAWICWSAFGHADVWASLSAGLGAELPAVTRVYLATSAWWGMVLTPLIAWLVWFATRPEPTARQFVALVVTACLVGAALSAWARMALEAPFLDVMGKIG